MTKLYGVGDAARVLDSADDKGAEPYRSPWRWDYARLIHSPSFRRLQGKTQVFPGHESDFYRNRLTHSLEVAQIAKSIAVRLNPTAKSFRRKASNIELDIVEFAGLAHDLGHPPFGHNGEEALDECMHEFGGFEGNAQSLRIVSRLEKKAVLHGPSPFGPSHEDRRCGLNLTYRSLASLLKYDRAIPVRHEDRAVAGVMKGFYAEDVHLVAEIKKHVLGTDEQIENFKTIECSIMDIADDIAYSTYDLEDNFKAGFLTPMALLALADEIYGEVAATIRTRILKQYPERREFSTRVDGDFVKILLAGIFYDMLFHSETEADQLFRDKSISSSFKKYVVSQEVQAVSRKLASDGYQRIRFTSALVQQFIAGVEVVVHEKFQQLNNVKLDFDTFLNVEALKNITYHGVIRSPGLQVVEYRGKDIVKGIFKALSEEGGTRLLPDDFRAICTEAPKMLKMRTICDFIAGMTDRYAFEFYGRLYGAGNLTVHKPI